MKYNDHEDMDESYPTTSLISACFTTMHGRLCLLEYLLLLCRFADSICFISRKNLPQPKLGNFLGDLTDQLQEDYGEGSFCTHFCSAQITRMPRFRIITRPSHKTWRVCLTKRRRVENKTVPYGFKGQLLDSDDYDCCLAMDEILAENAMDTM